MYNYAASDWDLIKRLSSPIIAVLGEPMFYACVDVIVIKLKILVVVPTVRWMNRHASEVALLNTLSPSFYWVPSNQGFVLPQSETKNHDEYIL